ncbi:Serine/threonine-protein kinase PAK 2 [Bulinus truncatus]|nr:Serine/threonine-protein kinase PAK 2 [Bulinus truncatus]
MSEIGEKPPAPPMRLESTREAISHEYKPLPREPDSKEERKKKAVKAGQKVKLNSDKPVISFPSNFEHTVHVGFDPHTGEFTGMPESWAKLLQSANISKSEQKKNPQAVLDVLNYYDTSSKERQDEKFMLNVNSSSASSSKSNLSEKSSTVVIISQTKQDSSPTISANGEEEEEDVPPPPIAARPDKTKSIYTKPIEQDEKAGDAGVDNKAEKPKKTKMTSEEIMEKLRTIVSIGDPNRKYTKMEKIGQGSPCVPEIATDCLIFFFSRKYELKSTDVPVSILKVLNYSCALLNLFYYFNVRIRKKKMRLFSSFFV